MIAGQWPTPALFLYNSAHNLDREIAHDHSQDRFGPKAASVSPARLRIGTRASPLARVQTDELCRRLGVAWPDLRAPGAIEIVPIRTTGDAVLDRPLAEIGGKALFTKEIEDALRDRLIDLAVHSMKDVATVLPDGLVIACVLPREDPRDVLIASLAQSLSALPAGARVGTGSLRRRAQILARRPDVAVVPLRGNVGTRLDRVAAGAFDATILAMAGLRRLGLDHAISAPLDPDEMLPAIGQGAIGVECRADDDAVRALLAPLDHADSAIAVAAERALLAGLDGSCHTPIAGLAILDGAGFMVLRGLVARPDGSAVIEDRDRAPVADAALLGRSLAERLRARAGPGFLPGY